MHVIPRDVGNIADWSGKNAPDGRSPLCDYAATLGTAPLSAGSPVFNVIWFSPFTETTDMETYSKGELKKGSLYGIRNHFRMDADITSGNDDEDREHLKHFCQQAHQKGIKVIGDLVFNHVPIDHPLAIEEKKLVESLTSEGKNPERIFGPSGKLMGLRDEKGLTHYLKFVYYPNTLAPVVDGSLEQQWADVVKINYESPATLSCFVTGENGKPGLWKQTIDWFMDSGFDGFRCDAAYKVPQKVWKELINHTRARKSDALYIAETLGGSLDDMERNINSAGFDLCTQGTYYWDIENDWYRQEAQATLRFARGGMGMAETHDVPNSVAEGISQMLGSQFNGAAEVKLHQAIAAVCLRDYALSALLGSAVCMEYGFERQLPVGSVFREPELFAQRRREMEERKDPGHPRNISQGIRAVNEYVAKFAHGNDRTISLDSIDNLGNGLIRYKCTVTDTNSRELLGHQEVYASKQPEHGAAFALSNNFLPPHEEGDSCPTLLLGGYLAARFTPIHASCKRQPVISVSLFPQ